MMLDKVGSHVGGEPSDFSNIFKGKGQWIASGV